MAIRDFFIQKPLASSVGNLILPGHHIHIQDNQGISGKRTKKLTVFTSAFVKEIQNVIVLILLLLKHFPLLNINGGTDFLCLSILHCTSINRAAGTKPAGSHQISKIRLQLLVILDQLHKLRAIPGTLAVGQLLYHLCYLFIALVASPYKICGRIYSIAHVEDFNEKTLLGSTVVKILWISHFAIPGLVMSENDIIILLKSRNFRKKLHSVCRMTVNPLHLPRSQLAGLLVYNRSQLDFTHIENLGSLGYKIQDFILIFQHLYHIGTATASHQKLWLSADH